MLKYFLRSFILLFLLMDCSPQLQRHFVQTTDIEQLPNPDTLQTRAFPVSRRRYDPLEYAPDTSHLSHTPMKFIRLNFHFMNSTDGKANLKGQEAINFTKKLIKTANHNMANNVKMLLPQENDTPVLPLRFKFVLTPDPRIPGNEGVYFHDDDELYYYIHRGPKRNRHTKDVIKKYGHQLDTVLNIFMMPHHQDSLNSPTYNAWNVGIALGNAVKVNGIFRKGEHFATILSHEVGHILGLSHAWTRVDGCDDTPVHKNDCLNQSAPGCKGRTSNNIMDYNIYQKAWTPCQIGKIHGKFAMLKSRQRKFLEPRWCTSDESQHITIRDTVLWAGAKDLEGPLTIASGGNLRVQDRLSIPAGAKITIQPGGTLILDGAHLHNACGETWEGIEVQQLGDLKGQVLQIEESTVENAVHPYPLTD
ncbi:MAG: M43 family zinc metalloprotease [Saprospiraceae bacterium]|nr:M43 family zinc metalloprotease [Saprospiraceae bacterium]